MNNLTIEEKLQNIINKTEEWKKLIKDAELEQSDLLKITDESAKKLKETLESTEIAVQSLIEKTVSVNKLVEDTATQLARVNAQFKATSSGYQSAFDTQRASGGNPFMATDYISGASMLTTEQKAEFLRIVTDRDEYALNKLVADYKEQINEIYTDEYKSIKAKKEQLDAQQKALGERIQGLLDSIKGKENTADYRKTIDLIAKLRQDVGAITQQSGLLSQRIGQFDQNAQRIEGQVAVLNRAWDDDSMRRTLESGARGTESQGYSKEEVQWLINKALETGVGSKFDSVALTELLKKIDSAVPTKKYQLDLTVGDQKLSAFTDLSPEKFIEALLKARGTAI